ncbi:MAG: hypothetical protein HQ564_09690 [Candidatus Saganbacteria bacterium]|nr:hypothetical protein [Candidatus Saganbacteria bacterium]
MNIFSILGFNDHLSKGKPGVIENRPWYKITCSPLPEEGYRKEADYDKDGEITKKEAWAYLINSKKNSLHKYKKYIFNTLKQNPNHPYAEKAFMLMTGAAVDSLLINYLYKNISEPDRTSKKLQSFFNRIICKYIHSNRSYKLLPLFNHPDEDRRSAIIEYIIKEGKAFEKLKGWDTIKKYIIQKLDDQNQGVRWAAQKAVKTYKIKVPVNRNLLKHTISDSAYWQFQKKHAVPIKTNPWNYLENQLERDDSHFIKYPGCKLSKGGYEQNKYFVRMFIKERLALPDEIKKHSPVYKLLFCPNLIKYFRSHEVFWTLAKQVAALPKVIKTREVRIAYPGSGPHLAPLDLFHNLIRSGTIDRAFATFTDINNSCRSKMRTLLKGLVKRGIYTDLKIQTRRISSKKSITTFSFKYRGKEIQVRLALNMSGNKYYRAEYLTKSDIWVMHDPRNSKESDSIDLLTSFLQTISKNKNKIETAPIIVMENINHRRKYKGKFINDKLLVGEKSTIGFPYGHRNHYSHFGDSDTMQFGESHFPKYISALVFRPDLSLWKQLSPNEINSVLTLSTPLKTISLMRKDREGNHTKVEVDDLGGIFAIPKGSKKAFNRYFGRLFSNMLSAINKIKKINPQHAKEMQLELDRIYRGIEAERDKEIKYEKEYKQAPKKLIIKPKKHWREIYGIVSRVYYR